MHVNLKVSRNTINGSGLMISLLNSLYLINGRTCYLLVFVQYHETTDIQTNRKVMHWSVETPFLWFLPHKLTFVALEIYIWAEGIFCFIRNAGTQIKREIYFTDLKQTKDHPYLAIHHCYYHVYRFIHTQRYINGVV